MFEFDADTALTEDGDGRQGTITDRWNVGPIPNGGYIAAIGATAMAAVATHPDPMSVTTHFLRPAVPGPVRVVASSVRTGRTHTWLQASLTQESGDIARMMAIFGDLDGSGPTSITGVVPELPDPALLVSSQSLPKVFSLARRFDMRLDPATAGGAMGSPTGTPEMAGWMRFADGREPDTRALVLCADAMPPPVLNLIPAAWVPTLEYTVHVRARPAPGWLRGRFRTRFLMEGLLEEDGELWDSEDRLVALSRQFARVRAG
jgi:acyl-CoA thioesterase